LTPLPRGASVAAFAPEGGPKSMSRLFAAVSAGALFCLLSTAVQAESAGAGQERLTPERVFSDPDLNGPRARDVQLSPDGKLVTYLKGETGDQNVLDLWAADTAGGAPFKLIDAKELSPPGKELSEAEKSRRERMRQRERGVIEYGWDQEGRFILVPLDGDLYLADAASGKVRRLTNGMPDEIDAKVSPHGAFVSYVRDQNLYVMNLASGRERALTTDGKGALSWAVAEFIAEEEMGRDTGYWWSPDEKRIALTRVDESGVDIIPRLDIDAEGVKVVPQRYPRAGRPNAVVDLYIEDVASGRRIPVDLGANKDIYLARVDWSKDGTALYVQRQTRDQKRLDLLEVDPATGKSKAILTETSPHWVELNSDFKPLKSGDFLWGSERSGYKHLYLYDRHGTLIRQITHGDWPVDSVSGVDEDRQLVEFLASKDTPLERHLYAVSYATPGEPQKLTGGDGWWTTETAKTGGAFTGVYSDPHTPPRTGLFGEDGHLIRWIEPNTLDASHPLWKYAARMRFPTYGTIKASDGSDMYYSITTPPDFDPSKRYPVIVSVYGGPHAQMVRKAWGALTDQLLLEDGYVIFRLDNRGSYNRSFAFKSAIDRNLGKLEVEDQLAGVAWLKSLPYVDPKRIGVTGWSYGGFMTLSLLTAPNSPFVAGAAGAPPVDWTLYDTHYTEQFMGQPSENPAGYKASEIVPKLPQMTGQLLLLQGMADDNVSFENSTRVMYALQGMSRPFELMTYPGQRHGLRGNPRQLHLWRTYLDFFDRKLKHAGFGH
jgi:dipeptidyl-peptidase-4